MSDENKPTALFTAADGNEVRLADWSEMALPEDTVRQSLQSLRSVHPEVLRAALQKLGATRPTRGVQPVHYALCADLCDEPYQIFNDFGFGDTETNPDASRVTVKTRAPEVPAKEESMVWFLEHSSELGLSEPPPEAKLNTATSPRTKKHSSRLSSLVLAFTLGVCSTVALIGPETAARSRRVETIAETLQTGFTNAVAHLRSNEPTPINLDF